MSGTIFFILLAIVVAFLSVDVFIGINEWQSRIYIGRWNDRIQWQKAIEKKAEDWLKNVPTVRMTSQNRLLLLDVLNGKYSNKAIQTWQIAGLLLGLDRLSAEKYVKAHPNLFVQKDVLPEDYLLAYAMKKKRFIKRRTRKDNLGGLPRCKEYRYNLLSSMGEKSSFCGHFGYGSPVSACLWLG